MSVATQQQQPQQQQQLVKGQSYLVWIVSGAMLLVEEGSMIVNPSSGDPASVEVPAGACYTAEQSGWVQLRSGGATCPDGITTVLNIAPARRPAIKWRQLFDKLFAKPAGLGSHAPR